MAASNNTHGEGSEAINFRAALAAFEQNATATTASFHSPKTRPSQPAVTRPPPQTPARPSSGLEPIPRSASTPRIRNNSESLMPPSSNNPFAASGSPTPAASSALPTTSASGMLSAPPPAFSTSASPTYPQSISLRKSGSGVSLNELMKQSSPRNSTNSRTASPLLRSRSRSVVENDAAQMSGNASSAPASGRSSPLPPPRSVNALFTPDDRSAGTGARRTESPASWSTAQHMLDTSADDDMFAHAVMERSSTPASPSRRAATTAAQDASLLPLPPQVPSRKGSASSTNSASTSASTPRLPPRPGGAATPNLAPSPTISEFGQFPSTASTASTTPRAKTGLGYATYTPGARRGAREGGGGRADGSMTPPALPPRSATLGQADRGRVGDAPYRARQNSPMKRAPVIPKKPATSAAASVSVNSKPPPPPRPAKAFDGAAGGFRFGTASEEPQSQPAPRPRQRTMAAQQHQRSLTGSSSSFTTTSLAGNTTHRKSGSNVFTSISLSDDASGELKRSLESDIHADHQHQLPPPSRGRSAANAAAGWQSPASSVARPASTSGGATTGGSSAAGGVVSSLIGTAASALPLFKSGGASGAGSRSLADGAPSKQPYYSGGATVSRSTSAHSDVKSEGEETLWGGGRAVQLADDASVLRGSSRVKGGGGLLKEPKDASAQERYETLYDKLLSQQHERKANRTAPNSNASTIREANTDRKASGGVQALKGWFESDPASSSSATAVTTPLKREDLDEALSPKMVRKVWTRSRLPTAFLAQVWDQAVSQTGTEGLTRDIFVRAMAGIDAELERKKQRRDTRRQRRSAYDSRTTGARRVPPPPPS
ncbi:hypothetical protein EX895_004286 [Sporisorium graminicola]|uniref:EH domain-containing protein n=1 Tax=Sporisorium graminicola TaxID=280036 RepID=A0A4U7KRR1_9BASI|nr:hypothetical protein EX895_004286 [Sporisorium graminicola]TKY86647.1 hypothetical protein EX895_004286 [Sporisorium graminicola]